MEHDETKGADGRLQPLVGPWREIGLLRNVYEAARSVLRYGGVDAARVAAALHEMDCAIEAVKQLDAGYDDEDEDMPPLPYSPCTNCKRLSGVWYRRSWRCYFCNIKLTPNA